jgi:hypothetical protein
MFNEPVELDADDDETVPVLFNEDFESEQED